MVFCGHFFGNYPLGGSMIFLDWTTRDLDTGPMLYETFLSQSCSSLPCIKTDWDLKNEVC